MPKKFEIKTVFAAVDRLTRPVSRMQSKFARFTRSMRRGLHRVNRITGKLARSLGKGLKYAGVAAVAAVAAVGAVILRTTKRMDELAKISRRLDFNIEAFQEWKFVAEQSGVSTDKFNVSMDRFAKTIGEAKMGQGTLTTLLNRYNPALLEQLKNTNDTSGAFDVYIKAMQNIEDPTKRVALGMLAFGRSGAAMANIAGLGAEAIKKLREEMRKNGLVTKEQAKAAEKFNDMMNSVKKAVQGVLVEAIAPLLPEMTQVIKKIRIWVIENKDLIKLKIKDFIFGVAEGVKKLVKWFSDLSKNKKLMKDLGEVFKFLGDALGFVVKHGKKIAVITGAFLAFAAAVKVAMVAVAAINLIMSANPAALLVLGIAAIVAVLIDLVTWATTGTSALGGLWDALGRLITSLGDPALRRISDILGFLGFESASKKVKYFAEADKSNTRAEAYKDLNKRIKRFGKSDESNARGADLKIVSPAERNAIQLQKTSVTTTNKSEVTIKDDTGRAKVTKGKLGNGLTMQKSGAF